jgi:hypothetical protein
VAHLEAALAEAEAERSDLRTKYVALGDKMDSILQSEGAKTQTLAHDMEQSKAMARAATKELALGCEEQVELKP